MQGQQSGSVAVVAIYLIHTDFARYCISLQNMGGYSILQCIVFAGIVLRELLVLSWVGSL